MSEAARITEAIIKTLVAIIAERPAHMFTVVQLSRRTGLKQDVVVALADVAVNRGRLRRITHLGESYWGIS